MIHVYHSNIRKVSEKYVDRYYQDNVWNSSLFNDCSMLLASVNWLS